MNVYIGTYSILPSEYQEVEWIGNSGTQYIDTGVAVPNHKVIANIEYINFGTWMSLGAYLGPDGGVPGGHVRLYGGYALETGQWAYGFLNSYSESGGSVSLNTKYVLEVSTISGNIYFKHDGTTYGSSSSTYSTSLAGNFGILGSNSTQSWEAWNSAKVYDYKIYDNTNNLIRDFVPCYRKADDEIGMYDLVNNQFYTNSGSGTFSKGNDVVRNELKNDYIGEYKSDLYYDFTQSDGGWVADSDVSRSSNGFYINISGTFIEKLVAAPNEIYDRGIPKKITIIYNKSGSDTGTGIRSGISGTPYYIFLPYDYSSTGYLDYLGTNNNGTISRYSLGANPTGVVTWEVNIDSSTSNRTVTHNITGCPTVSETSGALKMIFNNKNFHIRLVHWLNTGIYIRSILFEY